MGSSIALTELTAVKHQRMKACFEIQQRSNWRPPYALTTSLELQAIELPRFPAKSKVLRDVTFVAVPHANAKYRVHGVKAVIWPFALDKVLVERQFSCTSPVCTWAMLASYLDLEELIVLADSMMRRDRRLRRARVEDFVAYLDAVESQVQSTRAAGDAAKLFKGYENCRRALILARSGTDSSMESRTRFVPSRYGLDCPQVNYPIFLGNSRKPLYLDMAYPEFKICIEYEGSHHAGQWLSDVRRRQAIEDAGWSYIQVTKLDIGDECAEEALALRIAKHMQEITGKRVALTRRKTILQMCDGRGKRRKPLHERLRFKPLLPLAPLCDETRY
ncbi:hypothetical protein [Bifidobacterium cebidarum]|uniref:DUF559 domain-containing protein n=1 Tax=Bifidobacterium cebidarum TaxID=2650773 RepID=A0A6I1GAU2_9BIFI|nr:hypothetical protein [Bifidobacterium cebidarum]KAB7788784.1 hypothetical protein F7D08_0518 [Bifidobacterium cebidarum]